MSDRYWNYNIDELEPGKRYVFVIEKFHNYFISSYPRLEGTFLGIEIDWKNTSPALPLLNPPKYYKFETSDGATHKVHSRNLLEVLDSPANKLYIPPDDTPEQMQEFQQKLDAIIRTQVYSRTAAGEWNPATRRGNINES